MKDFINGASSDLERLRAEKPRPVRIGGIVLVKLGAVGPATECKVERIVNITTGNERTEAELAAVRLFCKVEVRPSGRKLDGPDDMSVGPWEPGETRTVLVPGYDVHRVVS
jgi:hypothetical protein